MGRIVVIGSSNTDMIVKCDKLPRPGETVLGDHFTTAGGGKGANQGVAAARLGAEVTLVARVGSDWMGEQALMRFHTEKINCDYVTRDENAPSGVALIFVDSNGENLIGVASGANSTLTAALVERAEPAIREADAVLMQLEIPLEAVDATVRLCRKWDINAIINPAPARELPPEIIQGVILTPNEIEARNLVGAESSRSSLTLIARQLLLKGARAAIVTEGAKGALIAMPSQIRTIAAFQVQTVDTTGAGDAFNGGLAVALSRGEDMSSSVRYACAVAALSVTRLGAQTSFPSSAEVDAFLLPRIGALA